MASFYQQLSTIFEKLWHIEHILSISRWDEAVMMPSGSGLSRAKALASVESLHHSLLTDPQIADLIKGVEQESLSDWQAANVEWMRHQYLNACAVPAELVEERTRTTMACEQAWRRLRTENNWQDFAPHLEKTFKIIETHTRMRTDAIGKHKNCYDTLLDDYSPGMSAATISPIFSELKTALIPVLQRIINAPSTRPPTALDGPFDIKIQQQVCASISRSLGFDFNHGRLDISDHPFCGGTPTDVRMTTRYHSNECISAIMGVCHETGHALYEQHLPKEWISQPVGRALGMTVHESQSLIIEMQACRSYPFMQLLAQLLNQHFTEHPPFTADDLYQRITQVTPGKIRVDADDVTYPLHIMLRYELESALFSHQIGIRDLPALWDEKMQAYLNVNTKGDYTNGVMQDVHWAAGLFGYFPAYTLGRLTAAQLYHHWRLAAPGLEHSFAAGNFQPLIEWLNCHIYSKASSLDYQNLLSKATGHPLSAAYYLRDIQHRYD